MSSKGTASNAMRVLIWDFDGTLGYREGGMFRSSLCEIIHREAPELDVSPDQFGTSLWSGFPWHTPERPHLETRTAEQWWDALDPVFERALRSIGLEVKQARILAKQVRRVFPDPERWRLFDDALPTLDLLSARGWTHVVLSNHVPELRDIVRHLELGPRLAAIFNSAEIGYEKPHPQAFRTVRNAIGDAAPVWMIGDNFTADIAGAEAVGIPGILVRNAHEEARFFCDDLTQVPTIVFKKG